MTLIDKACFERGCACYDSRDKGECVEVVELESQEPVAWRYGALLYHDKLDAMEFIRTSGDSYLLEPLYTHPPQRTWAGLTDEEVVFLKMLGRDLEFVSMNALRRFTRDIEQTLKEKNNA